MYTLFLSHVWNSRSNNTVRRFESRQAWEHLVWLTTVRCTGDAMYWRDNKTPPSGVPTAKTNWLKRCRWMFCLDLSNGAALWVNKIPELRLSHQFFSHKINNIHFARKRNLKGLTYICYPIKRLWQQELNWKKFYRSTFVNCNLYKYLN